MASLRNNYQTQTSGRRYIPGNMLDLSGGITLEQFKEPEDVSFHYPGILAFMRAPNQSAKSVVIANVSAKDLVVNVSLPSSPNLQSVEDSKQNTTQLEEFFLPHGQSAKVDVDPSCYILHLSAQVPSAKNGKVILTGRGWSLKQLMGKDITIVTGHPDGIPLIKEAEGTNGAYVRIFNTTRYDILASIKKMKIPSGLTSDQERMLSGDNQPDFGVAPLEEKILAPDTTWNLLVPSDSVIVTFDEPDSEAEADSNKGFFTNITEVPDDEDYVEYGLARVTAEGGTVVIVANSEDDSSIEAKTFNYAQCVPVNPGLVITE